MGDEPGRVREDAFAMGDFERLLDRVIERRIGVLAAFAGRFGKVVNRRVPIGIAMRPGQGNERGGTLAKCGLEMLHAARQGVVVIGGFTLGTRNDAKSALQHFLMGEHDFFRVGFPLAVFELFPHASPFFDGGRGFRALGIMKHEILIGGQQCLKNVLVFFHAPRDNLIGFIDEETGGAERAAVRIGIDSLAAFDVLEHFRRVRITEKLAEEAHDARVRDGLRYHLAGIRSGIDAAEVVGLVIEQTIDFAEEILAGAEPALIGSFE